MPVGGEEVRRGPGRRRPFGGGGEVDRLRDRRVGEDVRESVGGREVGLDIKAEDKKRFGQQK